MVNARAYTILLVLTVALLCTGCTTSPSVNTNTHSRAQPPDSPKKSPPATFDGRVLSIEDGDTLIVLDDANRTYKIRLQGIDAPEGGQAFGNSSRQNLNDIVFGKHVEIEWSKRDRYGRIVGKVLIDGDDVCLQQIKAGMAWHYKYYQNEQTRDDQERYANAEIDARSKRHGLWRDEHPIPPWEFRRGH